MQQIAMKVTGDSLVFGTSPAAPAKLGASSGNSGQCSFKKDGCRYSTAVAKKTRSKEIRNYDAVQPRMVYPRKGDGLRHSRQSLRCAHQLEGCQFSIEHTELSDHERECEFRRVPCPDGLCGETVKYLDLEQHIRQQHPDADWEEESGDTALRNWFISRDHHLSQPPSSATAGGNSNNWVLNIWIHDGATFISRFRKHGGMWYTWVSMVGSASDSLPFHCIIRTAGDEGRSRMTYEGPVHCIDRAEEEIINSSECLIMTDTMVELYMERVKKLDMPYTDGYDGRLPIDYTVKRS